jgi:hypothetical protein
MIDTIRVKSPCAPTPAQLEWWECHTRTKPTGEVSHKYILNRKLTDDDISVRCTHFPFDYDGNPMTTVELSLPKVVFGDNFTMLRDLDEAIQRTQVLLSAIRELPPINLDEAVLIRVDPCYNHHVGQLVPDYINAIGRLNYPHRRTKYHQDEGAEFRSKKTTTKFYDKMRETGRQEAYGILRQETSYLSSKRIAKLLGKNKPTLRDLTPEWIAANLNADLENLRLDNRIIADRDTALRYLCQQYGSDAGIYYWALLIARFDTSKRQLRSQTALHPRKLDRRLKAIADAGIAPTLATTTEPLPPLTIEL